MVAFVVGPFFSGHQTTASSAAWGGGVPRFSQYPAGPITTALRLVPEPLEPQQSRVFDDVVVDHQPSPYVPPSMIPSDLLVAANDNSNILMDLNTLQPTTTLPETSPVPPSKSLRHKLGLDNAAAVATKSPSSPLARNSKVVGHRGAPYRALENTRESFWQCQKLGCDAIELDVFWLPKEDEENGNEKGTALVVFHGGGTDEDPGHLSGYCYGYDDAVTKNNNKETNTILDLTFAETQELAFNPDFAEFPCPPTTIQTAKIPTLEQVLLDLKDLGMEIKIELKGPGVVEPVLEVVERLGMQEQVSYSSFNLVHLQYLRSLRPDPHRYSIGAIFTVPPDDYLDLAQAVGATEIHLQYDQCSVSRIQEIHQAGYKSMAWLRSAMGMRADADRSYWDVSDEDEACYQALLETGVQQICCNKPDLLIQMLKDKR